MTTRTLSALERAKDQYGAGSAAVKLVLLHKLARGENGPVVIDYFDDLSLSIEVA